MNWKFVQLISRQKDFRWSTSLNLGHNANKILKLDGDLKQVTSGTSIHKVGLPYSTYYMIEFAGIDPVDGEPMFYKNTTDENGNLNKETTKDPRSAEKVILQCADPTITGGLGNSISYKWFDLNFNVNFSFGAWNYDGAAGKLEHGGDGTLNIPTYYRKRWQKEGDETSIERVVVGRSNFHDRLCYHTSFIQWRLCSSEESDFRLYTARRHGPGKWV